MSENVLLKKISKHIGQALDGAISGAGKLAGKGIEKKGYHQTAGFVKDTTNMIGKASNASVQTTGQLAEGLLKTVKGQVQKNTAERGEGVGELKDAGTRVVKGIGQTIKMGTTNAYNTGAGLLTKDYDRAKHGALNLAKLGIVAATAVSVLDIVSGPDAAAASDIQALNAELDGQLHPVTGVPFAMNTIEHNGLVIEDVFPVFDAAFETQLPEVLYLQSDHSHISFANGQLADAVAANPNLIQELQLSTVDLQKLQMYQTPDGYTWHHHETPGVMQLVNTEQHEATAHTGGRLIWGGGSEYR